MLEVGVQRLVFVRQNGQCRIRSHRTGCLFTVLNHRLKDDLDVFLRVAKSLLAIEHGSGSRLNLLSRCRHFVQTDADLFNPLTVRLGFSQRILQFHIVNDATLFKVDQEHLARLQAPFLDDFLFRNRQHAGFGSHDHEVIIGHQITGRTQAVTVKRGTNLATIGKSNRGRAVPRLHHCGVVFVEGATVLIHLRVLFPSFGNHQHHGMSHRIAAHHQQFESVVKGSRI